MSTDTITEHTITDAGAAADADTSNGVATSGADDALVEEDLLVEEVSIDGMCGVY